MGRLRHHLKWSVHQPNNGRIAWNTHPLLDNLRDLTRGQSRSCRTCNQRRIRCGRRSSICKRQEPWSQGHNLARQTLRRPRHPENGPKRLYFLSARNQTNRMNCGVDSNMFSEARDFRHLSLTNRRRIEGNLSGRGSNSPTSYGFISHRPHHFAVSIRPTCSVLASLSR